MRHYAQSANSKVKPLAVIRGFIEVFSKLDNVDGYSDSIT